MISSHENTECRVCSVQLSIHQRLKGICDNVECRRKDVPYQGAIRRREIQKNIRNRVPAAWNDNSTITLLPYNSAVLQPLEQPRRELFEIYLAKVVKAAFAHNLTGAAPSQETSAPVNGTTPEQAQLPVLGQACGLCGGHCCNTGGTSAWLETASIERVLSHHPDFVQQGAEQLTAHYLSFLPTVSNAGSCVFHASEGCNLPKELRSNVCNQFICNGLADLVNKLPDSTSSSIVASVSNLSIERVALMTRTEIIAENGTLLKVKQIN